MKNHHGVGHFKKRLMIVSLSLFATVVMAGQSYAATDCSTCHGMPPLDSADGSRQPATGAFKGSHQSHVSPSALATDCVVCHSAAAGYDMKHSATSGNVIGLSASINGGTYSKGVSFSQSSLPIMGSCSNVSCHSDPYSAATVITPDWGTSAGCAACHTGANVITANGPATGSHTTVAGHAVACISCHEAGTSATTVPSTGHIDTNIDVANVGYATLNKVKGTAGTTCSTASCHPDPYSAGTATTPAWGTTANGCAACHTGANVITASGPATGSHAAHAAVACISCHAAGTTATTAPSQGNGHIDGNIDIFSFNYPANVAKHTAGSYTGTCSTAYCHSNGNSTFSSPTWGGSSTGCNFCHPNLSAGHSIHVGSLLTEISFYAYTSTKSTGTGYKFGCANCHPLTVASHMNSSVDVDLTASVSGGHLKAQNGSWSYTASQCNNVYCHSNGYKPGASFTFAQTPTWLGSFTGDRCASCHGNSPNSNIVGSAAHSAHVVGIHYDDIFNGVSKKLPQSGPAAVNAAHGKNSRSTTINCNMCHYATVTSSANDKNSFCSGCHDGTTPPGGFKNVADPLVLNTGNHVNGKVDVSFIPAKIATKAQVVNSAFAAYTANASGWSRRSNSMPFKTYTSSYDYTKSTLAAGASPYTAAAGCLNIACHASIPVKWTDSVTCTSCHTRLK